MDSKSVGFALGVARRAGRATSVASLSSSESEEEDEDDEEEEEKEPLRADKIVARKKLLPSEWRELCKDMNTAEVCVSRFWGCVQRNVLYVRVKEDRSLSIPFCGKNQG